MSRKHSRKVMYEVSSESRKSRKSGAKLEISKRVKAFSNSVVSRRVDKSRENPKKNARPSQMKRLVFLFSALLLKIPVKKALVVLVIFAAVVIFWPNGGNDGTVEPEPGHEPGSSILDGTEPGGSGEPVFETGNSGNGEVMPVVAGPPKDHYIVVASHKDIQQLEPVKEYFAKNGIETELRPSGSWQTLITKDRYLSTRDPQSKVYRAKKKIIEIGDEYKPPTGFGSFSFDSVLIKKL
jgi:hypothetical protein